MDVELRNIWFIKLNIENNILLFKGVLLSSARHPSLDALQWIPSISLINLICSFSNGSESLNVESTPQTSLPYVVFSSNGKTYLSQFTCNNVDLETLANYCYLGMVLKFNGNFNLAINTLMEKARKAYFECFLKKLYDS
jgi:hypothetical protein